MKEIPYFGPTGAPTVEDDLAKQVLGLAKDRIDQDIGNTMHRI